MMKERINKNGILDTLRFVEPKLIGSTMSIQFAEAAITIGEMDLSFGPDKVNYERLLLQRQMLIVIAGNNICLN